MNHRLVVALGAACLATLVACGGVDTGSATDAGSADARIPDGDAAGAPAPGIPRIDATIPGHALATVALYGSVIVVDDKGAVWDIAGSRVQRYGTAPGFDSSARDVRLTYERRLVYATGNEIRALKDGAVVVTSPEGPIRSFVVVDAASIAVVTASGKLVRVEAGVAQTIAEGTVGGVGGGAELYFAKSRGELTDYFAVRDYAAPTLVFSAVDAAPVRFFGAPPIATTASGAFVLTQSRSRLDVPRPAPVFDLATTADGMIFAAVDDSDPSQTAVRVTDWKTSSVRTVRVTKSKVLAVGFTSTQGPYWFENEADGSSTLYGLGTGNIARP